LFLGCAFAGTESSEYVRHDQGSGLARSFPARPGLFIVLDKTEVLWRKSIGRWSGLPEYTWLLPKAPVSFWPGLFIARAVRSPRYRHRVKNMFVFAIVLGAIWVIGVFVFWCDVTDSWKNVSRRVSALLPPNSPPRGAA
jgi:hypothetical protein